MVTISLIALSLVHLTCICAHEAADSFMQTQCLQTFWSHKNSSKHYANFNCLQMVQKITIMQTMKPFHSMIQDINVNHLLTTSWSRYQQTTTTMRSKVLKILDNWYSGEQIICFMFVLCWHYNWYKNSANNSSLLGMCVEWKMMVNKHWTGAQKTCTRCLTMLQNTRRRCLLASSP